MQDEYNSVNIYVVMSTNNDLMKKPDLSEDLHQRVDRRVDELYGIILDVMHRYAAKGYTNVTIYFPAKTDSKTEWVHNHRIDGYYPYICERYIRRNLTTKFKMNGVKVNIEYYFNLVHCKWDKDYSKKSSCSIS